MQYACVSIWYEIIKGPQSVYVNILMYVTTHTEDVVKRERMMQKPMQINHLDMNNVMN